MRRRELLTNRNLISLVSGLTAQATSQRPLTPSAGPRANYFPNVILRTHENATDDAFHFIQSRQHENRNPVQSFVGLNLCQYLSAIQNWHDHIEQDQVETAFPQQVESPRAIFGQFNLETHLSQSTRKQLTVSRIIIGHENEPALR